MDQDLDILIDESRSRIASYLGRVAEYESFARHEQQMLDALCHVRGRLEEYQRKYDGTSASLCVYINIEGLKATGIWTPEEFEEKLREACEADVKILVAFLRENEKKGYLNFHGDKKTKVLKTLQEHFPTMRRYKYNNFAAYF